MNSDRRDRRLRPISGKVEDTESEMQAWVKCRRRTQRRKTKRAATEPSKP
jgi:hypothetical protein